MTHPRPSDTLSTAHSLALLSEYTHTLDALPLDLARNFADLRELDAVLSSSVSSVTEKIYNLTKMIEDRTAPREERFWLLTEIAEEAARLKLGGEDKIRVACQAADNLKAHTAHLDALVDNLPSFDKTVLNRKTVYPHVSARSFMPPATADTGRRRRAALGTYLDGTYEGSPVKRRRAPREDDVDGANGRSPRKERAIDGSGQRSRNGARSRKADRAASPTESMISVTPGQASRQANVSSSSRLAAPPQVTASSSRASAAPASSSTAPPANKRSRVFNPSTHESESLLDQAASRRELFHTAPTSSSSHPSLPLPYADVQTTIHTYDLPGQHALSPADWTRHPPPTQLEGPGVPPVRPVEIVPTAPTEATRVSATVAATDAEGEDGDGDGDGDGDDRTYCVCDRVSFGEMIACDDANCDREWFHLACIGLTMPPSGRWYCDSCRTRRNAKKGSRSGRRKTAGGSRSTKPTGSG